MAKAASLVIGHCSCEIKLALAKMLAQPTSASPWRGDGSGFFMDEEAPWWRVCRSFLRVSLVHAPVLNHWRVTLENTPRFAVKRHRINPVQLPQSSRALSHGNLGDAGSLQCKRDPPQSARIIHVECTAVAAWHEHERQWIYSTKAHFKPSKRWLVPP
jgi:hypothetical protein